MSNYFKFKYDVDGEPFTVVSSVPLPTAGFCELVRMLNDARLDLTITTAGACFEHDGMRAIYHTTKPMYAESGRILASILETMLKRVYEIVEKRHDVIDQIMLRLVHRENEITRQEVDE